MGEHIWQECPENIKLKMRRSSRLQVSCQDVDEWNWAPVRANTHVSILKLKNSYRHVHGIHLDSGRRAKAKDQWVRTYYIGSSPIHTNIAKKLQPFRLIQLHKTRQNAKIGWSTNSNSWKAIRPLSFLAISEGLYSIQYCKAYAVLHFKTIKLVIFLLRCHTNGDTY